MLEKGLLLTEYELLKALLKILELLTVASDQMLYGLGPSLI